MTIKKHGEAMNYIYDAELYEDDDIHKVQCQADGCGRMVNLYDEPIYIMKRAYASTKKMYQQRWCGDCVRKGVK